MQRWNCVRIFAWSLVSGKAPLDRRLPVSRLGLRIKQRFPLRGHTGDVDSQSERDEAHFGGGIYRMHLCLEKEEEEGGLPGVKVGCPKSGDCHPPSSVGDIYRNAVPYPGSVLVSYSQEIAKNRCRADTCVCVGWPLRCVLLCVVSKSARRQTPINPSIANFRPRRHGDFGAPRRHVDFLGTELTPRKDFARSV